jgi:exosome complex protein LRP1
MTSETHQLKLKLATLSGSLDELEAKLEPLLAQSLPDSLADLESIQQAKLTTVLPYLVYDLIFSASNVSLHIEANFKYISVYLKSRGIDPKSHPVVSELVRPARRYIHVHTNFHVGPRKALLWENFKGWRLDSEYANFFTATY